MHSFDLLAIEVDELDRILLGQIGIVVIRETIEGRPVCGGLGDDRVFEFADGFQKFEDALQATRVGRTQLIVDGHIVGLDDHAPPADGPADFLFVNLQSAEGDVCTVVAVKQRNPAGGFGSGRLIRSMDEAGQAGCAHRRQPAKERSSEEVTTIGEVCHNLPFSVYGL